MANATINIGTELFTEVKDKLVNYFTTLNQFQQIAWGVIGLGLILVIISLFLF